LHADGATVLAASRLAAVEVAGALHRRGRAGDLAPDDAIRLARSVLEIVEARYEIQDPNALVVSDALRLLAHYRVSPMDALHLASARELIHSRPDLAITFLCADEILSVAARTQGLRVEDPSTPSS
jgi:predicted nucleic acid-binding protein